MYIENSNKLITKRLPQSNKKKDEQVIQQGYQHGQKAYEKVLYIIIYQEYLNENHYEVPLNPLEELLFFFFK